MRLRMHDPPNCMIYSTHSSNGTLEKRFSIKLWSRTVSFSFSWGFISFNSSWAFELMKRFMAASDDWKKSREICDANKFRHMKGWLTNHSIMIVILDAHGDVFDWKVHFEILDTQERSLFVFLLVWDAFEVNFAAYFLVVTPIFAGTRCFNQKPKSVFDWNSSWTLMQLHKLTKLPSIWNSI